MAFCKSERLSSEGETLIHFNVLFSSAVDPPVASLQCEGGGGGEEAGQQHKQREEQVVVTGGRGKEKREYVGNDVVWRRHLQGASTKITLIYL